MIVQNFTAALVSAYDGISTLFYIFVTEHGYVSIELSEIEEIQSSIAHYKDFREMYENITWHDWILQGIKNSAFLATFNLYNDALK